ncbi:Holliday junction resolvase RuvX [bacterium]|nr:Holliday junction resolvase RuvX [bacterium]
MKILGIDFGDRRVGIAVSDPSSQIALSRETLSVKNDEDALKKLAGVIQEESIERIVLGVPLDLDGCPGERAKRTIEFGQTLEETFGVRIDHWDERLTTRIAKRTLRESGRKSTRRDGKLDQISAVIILQGYLDRQSTSSARPIDE